MRLAYADPPYFGYGSFYDKHHPESRVWDELDAHRDLIQRLCDEFDGWALSMTSGNLHDILPLCPKEARIAAWVKPFASFKPNVSPAYTWEPVVFVPAPRKHDKSQRTVRDHVAVNITLQRGLVGAKPEGFCSWVLDLIGWQPDDELVDIFPGTGVMDRVVTARSGRTVSPEQLEFSLDGAS